MWGLTVGRRPLEFAVRVKTALELLGIGRTTLYQLIRSGRLRTVTQGRAHLIPAAAIRDYVALLEKEAEAGR
jgi:excisionase family DNA binding protein